MKVLSFTASLIGHLAEEKLRPNYCMIVHHPRSEFVLDCRAATRYCLLIHSRRVPVFASFSGAEAGKRRIPLGRINISC